MTPDERSWDRYLPLLHLHVRQLQLGRLYRRRLDSWDVVHDALLKALKNLDKFRGTSEAEFVAWLKKIAKNTLIDIHREHVLPFPEDEMSPLEAFLAASQPGASTLVVTGEELMHLASAIDRLPGDERDAIIAHCILELSLAEVAERLNRTERGVAGLLFRGKRRLRKMLIDSEDAA
jgi:RNA polymerase sigma-70 factor (ECF subfamily)